MVLLRPCTNTFKYKQRFLSKPTWKKSDYAVSFPYIPVRIPALCRKTKILEGFKHFHKKTIYLFFSINFNYRH